jgi:hypothetical protein
MTIADVMLFDIFDLHIRIFEAMKETHPTLAAHHEKVAAVPGIAAYLASPLRLPAVNGNGLG